MKWRPTAEELWEEALDYFIGAEARKRARRATVTPGAKAQPTVRRESQGTILQPERSAGKVADSYVELHVVSADPEYIRNVCGRMAGDPIGSGAPKVRELEKTLDEVLEKLRASEAAGNEFMESVSTRLHELERRLQESIATETGRLRASFESVHKQVTRAVVAEISAKLKLAAPVRKVGKKKKVGNVKRPRAR